MLRNKKGQFVGVQREKHPRWKGRILRDGYWYIKDFDHPYTGKQKYIAEHRLVMEKKLKRFLVLGEIVHHINGNRQDNRIENLKLFKSAGEHSFQVHPYALKRASLAHIGRKPPNFNRIKKPCLFCDIIFETTRGSSGKTYCSRECYWKSKVGKKPEKMEGLKLGRGWNKGIPMTWQLKGKDSPHFKHGKYSKYL